jgi:hypothetical protein
MRFTVWLTFFNSWVLFEETIIDRSDLWQYMPYYQVADPCLWDIGAMVLLAFLVWWIFRDDKAERSVPLDSNADAR